MMLTTMEKLNVGVAENTQGEKDAYFIQLDNQDIMDLLYSCFNQVFR